MAKKVKDMEDGVADPRRLGIEARMKDVASLANVSAMTVSRALKHPEKVSESTRLRIAKAMAVTGYVPNTMAGNLKNRTSNIVAAVVPSLQNALFNETLQGLSDGLSESGLQLVVRSTGYLPSGIDVVARDTLALRPCAMVLHERLTEPVTIELLRQGKVCVIETGDLVENPVDTVVSYSNRAAAFEMTRHLISKGYREIGVITLPKQMSVRSRERLAGYTQAMKEAELPPRQSLVFEAPGGHSSGAAGLAELVQRNPKLDAILGLGDVFAVGAHLACQRQGISIPEKLAIASFDDSEILTALSPPVTALVLPRYEIGSRCAELIIQKTTDPDPVRQSVFDLGFSIIDRQSA